MVPPFGGFVRAPFVPVQNKVDVSLLRYSSNLEGTAAS